MMMMMISFKDTQSVNVVKVQINIQVNVKSRKNSLVVRLKLPFTSFFLSSFLAAPALLFLSFLSLSPPASLTPYNGQWSSTRVVDIMVSGHSTRAVDIVTRVTSLCPIMNRWTGQVFTNVARSRTNHSLSSLLAPT